MSLPDEFYNVKFSGFMESIKILYIVDERFKEVCDEYCRSKKKTLKFQKKFAKSFNQKLKSENLSKELEEEILFYLMKRV